VHHGERADRGVHPAADRRPPRREHPGIEIEIVASNAARDLRRREADIAVRNFMPTQPELVARKIADRHARLYASPAYLARIGTRARRRTSATRSSSGSTARP
jgi:hypothetical protein